MHPCRCTRSVSRHSLVLTSVKASAAALENTCAHQSNLNAIFDVLNSNAKIITTDLKIAKDESF